MKIGIIGVGNITMSYADKASKSGYQVLVSCLHGNSRLKDIAKKIGQNIELTTLYDAAAAPIVIIFIPREYLETIVSKLPDMREKIILHTNNPIFNKNCFIPKNEPKSSCEILTALLPTAHVIKLFNTLAPSKLLLKGQNQQKTEIFFTGKNQEAKNNVKFFLETLDLLGTDITPS